MPCTLENVLADAKSLVERLRNHDNAAEMLIEQTSSLSKRVEAMKQVTGSHAHRSLRPRRRRGPLLFPSEAHRPVHSLLQACVKRLRVSRLQLLQTQTSGMP